MVPALGVSAAQASEAVSSSSPTVSVVVGVGMFCTGVEEVDEEEGVEEGSLFVARTGCITGFGTVLRLGEAPTKIT